MALVMIIAYFALYSMTTVPSALLSNAALPQSSTVYFSDGTPVGCFCSVNRISLSEAQIKSATNLWQAVLAAEDRSYFHEGGISVTGILRALKSTLTGGGVQGASTITEQFVKQYYTNGANYGNLTLTTKIKEIFVAIKLAQMKDKWWILTNYLNYIYLGAGANGVEAAAQTYFGKHAWQLDIAQAAMIAALIQAPSAFDPYQTNPASVPYGMSSSLEQRWGYVLSGMVTDGAISQAQANAQTFPRILPPSNAALSWSGYRGYIMSSVLSELETRYGYTQQQIESRGLQITTTFSKAKMDALYAAVAQMKDEAKAAGGSWPWWAYLGAVLEDPKTGGIEAMYAGPNYELPTQRCDLVKCQFNMAQQAREQVGSSFKPYVLAEAVSQGMNVQTSILNGYSPLCVGPDSTPALRAQLSQPAKGSGCPAGSGDYYVGYDPAAKIGPLPVDVATAVSSNPAYVDLVHYVGTQNTINLAKQFGVDTVASNLDNLVGQTGIALGIGQLTVQEQASTFATLANNGSYIQPHVIAGVTENGNPVPPKVAPRIGQPLNAAQAADVDWALSFDTNSNSGYAGTGTSAALAYPRPTIAKTGTTDSYHSAFFIGALPGQYSFAVGMFTAQPANNSETLGVLPSVGGWGGGYGGAWPARLWKIYMDKIIAMDPNLPVAQPPTPQLAGFVKWDRSIKVQRTKNCPPGGGFPGGGRGHGHHGCQNPGPNPYPTFTLPPVPGPIPSFSLPVPLG